MMGMRTCSVSYTHLDVYKRQEVCGTYKSDDRSPNGFELRLDTITILSEPAEPMPLQINKWKLNTSLEAKLNNRAVALRNPRERATFRIQEGITRGCLLYTSRCV